MSIGSFSFQSGLSITALRHYDEVGLLPPAYIDPSTGYRRYHPDQVRDARLICGLRAVDLPVDQIREVIGLNDESVRKVLEQHRLRLHSRARALNRMTATLDEYLAQGVPMPQQIGCRPVQVTIHADDPSELVTFYSTVFDVDFDPDMSSFQFGALQTESFFLLTIEPQSPEHPGYPGRGACFGFLVDDLDAVHERALKAGATEVHPPMEFEWKPRTSIVDDPSGNRVALSQA